VPLRAALELDRFGIVAHVLSRREGCTADKCDALGAFNDASHVLANLRDHVFEDEVTKYTAMWNAPRPDAATLAAVGPTAPLPGNLTPAPGSVSPRYDFPSSQSIPPVNIMANEPSGPRGSGALPNGDAGAAAALTPVPPRRPPQVRAGPAGAARPAAARPDNGDLPIEPTAPRGNAQTPR